MKKIILTISLLASFLFINGQGITKTKLTEAELAYLSKDIAQSWGSEILDDDLINSTKNNLMTYQFEIVYHDTVLYRGNIDKPILSEISFGMYRTRVQFCLDYKTLDAETKLELAESKELSLVTTESGNKYYCAQRYKLFENNYNNELTVYDVLSDKIYFKFYKLTEN